MTSSFFSINNALLFIKCYAENDKSLNTFLLQMSDTMTVFFGGTNDQNIILTFDWTTMTFQPRTERLIRQRVDSCCSRIKRPDGQVRPLLFIILSVFYAI